MRAGPGTVTEALRPAAGRALLAVPATVLEPVPVAFHRHFGHRILVGASGCEGEAALLSSVADSARGAWLASVGSCSVLPSRPQPRLLPGLTGVRRFWGRQPGFGPSRWIYALVMVVRGRCEATKFERETSSGPMRCVGRAARWSGTRDACGGALLSFGLAMG